MSTSTLTASSESASTIEVPARFHDHAGDQYRFGSVLQVDRDLYEAADVEAWSRRDAVLERRLAECKPVGDGDLPDRHRRDDRQVVRIVVVQRERESDAAFLDRVTNGDAAHPAPAISDPWSAACVGDVGVFARD